MLLLNSEDHEICQLLSWQSGLKPGESHLGSCVDSDDHLTMVHHSASVKPSGVAGIISVGKPEADLELVSAGRQIGSIGF